MKLPRSTAERQLAGQCNRQTDRQRHNCPGRTLGWRLALLIGLRLQSLGIIIVASRCSVVRRRLWANAGWQWWHVKHRALLQRHQSHCSLCIQQSTKFITLQCCRQHNRSSRTRRVQLNKAAPTSHSINIIGRYGDDLHREAISWLVQNNFPTNHLTDSKHRYS